MSHYSELTSASARRDPRRGGNRGTGAMDAASGGYDTEYMGSSYEESRVWDNIGTFGVALALGLTLGAGLALLLAPRSGEETRELLGERSRWVGDRVSGGFDDLREGVERATRRGRRKIRRGLTRGRWVVEDMRG